ncbi:response regulator transcription factor [Mucilaginibacter robiniae]|uniref:Response regulator transcription factor n=1 Tax=Mucilaginibacter robiniae TaxID=2728022 RepID=A0A7L5E183_9SPHI|nr:LytTR family DNA-binding domain-containing protein [Mucilaginibacter robiniae]QJD96258.1 response regulator transcription factor [Mucilaginibacter robiniae]
MLRCIIIDDEQFSVDALSSYIQLLPGLEVVGIYLDPLEALSKIDSSDQINIIFMDIDMPNLSGIELAKVLRHRTERLIFTTSHSQYAFDAYEVDGDAFLLKPFTFVKFTTTINRFFFKKDIHQNDRPLTLRSNHFFVKNKDENLRILNVCFDDVIAFESANNYVKIHVQEKKYITAYLTISDVLDIVSDRKEFRQFHRAFILSTRHIEYIEGTVIRLTNLLQVNVGESFKPDFNEFMNERLLKTSRKIKS